MVAAVLEAPVQNDTMQSPVYGHDDPFTGDNDTPNQQPYVHRYSSRFDLNSSSPGAASSPSQVKRILEGHLLETERRLQDAQRLGTSLLDQQAILQDKLREVEQQQDEATITPQLREQLETINKEHAETSKEIARSLLAPKPRIVTGADDQSSESGTYTSQATGSPTKISAPSRRSRNQPTSRTGDLQFAADISTSLLAQVRQLQAAVAERDETIKNANIDRLNLESDVQTFTQRVRDLQEHEQRYKDENWSLESQNHELLAKSRESSDKEKRFLANLTILNTEKSRLQSDMEEARMAHGQLSEEHSAARKAHETELHSLKRDMDTADLERNSMQSRIEELTSQNQELARAMAGKFRNVSPLVVPDLENDDEDLDRDLATPEHSPPPSPTKATPRHGGLESETLRSSLHHAHRMIQNLKGNIHREKTEKIELKRMLQDARDELEQRRSDTGGNSLNKRQKTRTEAFKKPIRPEQLGNSRQARTDVELEDGDWEDHAGGSPSGLLRHPGMGQRGITNQTDASDAYQTAQETESAFETADERHTTESEAFETGVESMAGDSSDDLTETEETLPRGQGAGISRAPRTSFGLKQAGNRNSYLSTASTSADEADDQLHTPVPSQIQKFKLKNGRSSYSRQSQIPYEGTPESVRTMATVQDSPSASTITDGQSPAAGGQSLFAELDDLDEVGNDSFGTPAKSSTFMSGSTSSLSGTPSQPAFLNRDFTPLHSDTPSRVNNVVTPATSLQKPAMVDSSTMTEPWQTETVRDSIISVADSYDSMPDASTLPLSMARATSPSDFPLPPTVPASPVQQVDTSTQYTPQRMFMDSPLRANNTFITPPKTVWDEASEAGSPLRDIHSQPVMSAPKPSFGYSGMLAQATSPSSIPQATAIPQTSLAYSGILTQETAPVLPAPAPIPVSVHDQITTKQTEQPKSAGHIATGTAVGGFVAAAVSALGFATTKSHSEPEVTTNNAHEVVSIPQSSQHEASRDVLDNSNLSGRDVADKEQYLHHGRTILYSSNDQGAQTLLTADQIEQAMKRDATPAVQPIAMATSGHPGPITPVMQHSTLQTQAPTRAPPPPPSKSLNDVDSSLTALPAVAVSSLVRPQSASSHRTSSLTAQNHPPLPPNYRTNIAKANGGLSTRQAEKAPADVGTATIMGPPLMPASAMRRPKTPSESMRSPTRENATPRPSQSSRQQRGTVTSQMSRRSSVSSFASELDERFNIRPGEQAVASNVYEGGSSTDPRMIQAITQTMIGEYLWKYTRKSMSKEFSTTRHRRYFWVHPYTKMLYWSTLGPEAGGNKETANKGVVIESVRVITDENPMPPGLHRKSLEVSTPGRKIRFTATTGQRHETWFNALSYLLLRGEPADQQGAYITGGNEITRDDVNEFNAGGYNAHLVPSTARQSMSSYNSRTTRGTSTQRNSRQPLPANIATNTTSSRHGTQSSTRTSSVPPTADGPRLSRADHSYENKNDRTIRAESATRISRAFSPIGGHPSQSGVSDVRGNQSGHRRNESDSSIYDASVVADSRDSAEEMRQEMLRQEAAGLGSNGQGLENVRACCDGKHDVSTLTHTHRHGDNPRALNTVSDKIINRSLSRKL